MAGVMLEPSGRKPSGADAPLYGVLWGRESLSGFDGLGEIGVERQVTPNTAVNGSVTNLPGVGQATSVGLRQQVTPDTVVNGSMTHVPSIGQVGWS